ncbi:MAG: O-methyltransferase [Flavihumibacter sp.]
MELIATAIEEYAEKYSSPEPALLNELAVHTRSVHPESHMLSGHLQGRLLAMISRLLQPRFVLEIGTFTGYSAVCLAEGLTADGQLHTIELRAAEQETAKKYFQQSSKAAQLFLHAGDAAAIIPALPFTWDLVFIDADKTGYLNYYELVKPRLRRGGLIIADNVLFHGKVLEAPVTGKSATAIQAFNEHVASDSTVERLLLPLRDGLFLIQKK